VPAQYRIRGLGFEVPGPQAEPLRKRQPPRRIGMCTCYQHVATGRDEAGDDRVDPHAVWRQLHHIGQATGASDLIGDGLQLSGAASGQHSVGSGAGERTADRRAYFRAPRP